MFSKEYDKEKLERHYNLIQEKIDKIEEDNARRFEWAKQNTPEGEPIRWKRNGYCDFCGAVRPSGEEGLADGCHDLLRKIFFGSYKEEVKEVKERLEEIRLINWKAYSNLVREYYLKINSKNEDMKTPKNFKTDFKKKFFESMVKAEFLSKKQVDVMLKEVDSPYNPLISSYTKEKEDLDNATKHAKNELFGWYLINPHFKKFAHITVAKAWL